MFDIMLKRLPNGRILVRDTDTKNSEVIKASELGSYFDEVFAEDISKENEEDTRIQQLRQEFAEKGLE